MNKWPYICLGTAAAAFCIGIFTGVFCAKTTLEVKYREQAEEEIESVKQAFANRPAVNLKENNLQKCTPPVEEKPQEESAAVVIPPEEYGEMDGYLLCELTAYADGVVTDEMNCPVDISDTIGEDALHRFGEYEEDAVYVRNDSRMCDYAVYRDLRTFAEVKKLMPPDIRELNDFPDDDEEDEETGNVV